MHGLNQTTILLLFIATAPVGLMPSIIAFLTKQHYRIAILLFNLILWALIYLGARNFTIQGSTGYSIPTFIAVLAWLALLGLAIRMADRNRRIPAP